MVPAAWDTVLRDGEACKCHKPFHSDELQNMKAINSTQLPEKQNKMNTITITRRDPLTAYLQLLTSPSSLHWGAITALLQPSAVISLPCNTGNTLCTASLTSPGVCPLCSPKRQLPYTLGVLLSITELHSWLHLGISLSQCLCHVLAGQGLGEGVNRGSDSCPLVHRTPHPTTWPSFNPNHKIKC